METLPSKLNEVVTKSKVIDVTKAQAIALNYAPLMEAVNEQMEALKVLEKGNKEHLPQAKRIRIELGHICSLVDDQKKKDKESILLESRLIDGLYNVVNGSARITQGEAKELEKHFEIIEEKRLVELQVSRVEECSKYLENEFAIPENLCKMDDEVYKNYLFGIKSAHEAKVAAEKKVEDERIAKEKADEAERIAMIAENAKLKKEKEAKDKADKIEAEKRAKVEAKRSEAENKSKLEAAAKLKTEQEAKQKLVDELKAKEESETKRLEEEKALSIFHEKVKLEAEQAELKKGDSDKVQDLKNDLEALKTKHTFKSAKYIKIQQDVNTLIDKAINHIDK